MAFEGLNQKLQAIIRKLNGKGKLSESDVKETMREIRLALLEADVNYLVVKDFIKKTSARAVGSEVMESLTPGQQVVKIVHEEMISLMGSSSKQITFDSKPPTVIMLCGLQGAGKTTLAGKLSLMLKKQGKKPLIAACDIYRPAAIQQLKVVGEKAGVPVFEMGQEKPLVIAKAAKQEAIRMGYDVLLIDTAGRLHIDEELMDELKEIHRELPVFQTILVVDAMTGQDAVNVAKTFDEQLSIDGVVLSKLDGDARGGAALSIRALTGKPILYSSIGEKLEDIEVFHPDRMASRILGMGDVLTLIEKAQQAYDEKNAKELVEKIKKNSFTLEDYLDQFRQMKKMGNMNDVLSMLPGMQGKMDDVEIDEKVMARTEAIILSMTPAERQRPEIINASRKKRIAKGCGLEVVEVNKLLRQYDATRKLMKQVSSMGRFGKKGMKMPFM